MEGSGRKRFNEQDKWTGGVLYTSRLRNFGKIIFSLSTFLRTSSYEWPEESRFPVITPSNYGFYRWRLNMTYQVFFTIFVLARTLQFLLRDGSLIEKAIVSFLAVTFTAFLIASFPAFFRWKDQLNLIRMSIQFLEEFERKYIKDGCKKPKIVKMAELAVVIIGVNIFQNNLILTAPTVLFPNSPASLSLFLSEFGMGNYYTTNWITSIGLKALDCMLVFYACTICDCVVITGVLVIAYTIVPSIVIMEELRRVKLIIKSAEPLALDELEPFKINTFTQLSYLTIEFGNVFTGMYGSLQVLSTIMAIIGASFGILMGDAMGLIIAALGLLILFCYISLVYSFLAKIESTSSRMIRSWCMDEGKTKLFRKKVKALRPLRIYVGGSYYINKDLITAVCKFTFDAIVSILLTF